MIAPDRLEYDLGANMHGQRCRLVRERTRWRFHKDAANQRDDPVIVELTDEQVRLIGEIGRG